MTTFSQLIDRIAKETVRPDLIDIALTGYLNQTIREMFVFAETKMPVFYDDSRVELEIEIDTVDSQTGAFVWAIPNPTKFQLMESVYYTAINGYVYPGNPKTALMSNDFDTRRGVYWYRVGQTIVFSNPGRIGDRIKLSWFEYPRSLFYYKTISDRPVVYNEEEDLYYVKAGLVAEEAMEKSTNWILRRHPEVIAEGLRAKIYKRLGEDSRMRTHYSQFESSRLGVQNTEGLKIETMLAR